MTNDEFKNMPKEGQLAWLEAQTDAGRTIEDILSEIGIRRFELRDYGFTYSLGKWTANYLASEGSLIDQKAWAIKE